MTYKEAVQILFNETAADFIEESYETPDFFEFYVRTGGDPIRYRIYKKDGRICEK